MRSQNAEEVLKLRGSPLFSSILNSISCLVTIVETDIAEEGLRLIEMVNELSVATKYLLLIVPTFDLTAIENQTINFQVIVNHGESGNKILVSVISFIICVLLLQMI